MAQKKFRQNFASDYGGISGECTALEPDGGDVNRAVNFEFAVGNSLRGRVGCQVTGSGGHFGLFSYTYSRTQDEYALTYAATGITTTKTTADGMSISKLMAINNQLWVLDTMTIPVTRVSGTYPFTWYSYAAPTGPAIHFVIKANGVSILDFTMGTGIDGILPIYSLLSIIDAIPELSISKTTRGTCPPYGLATAAATATIGSVGYGTRYRITCSAHNFQAGDIITFRNPTTFELTGGFVVAVNTGGTNIDYVGQIYQPINGELLGYMNQSAEMFPIGPITADTTAASGTLNIKFPYWRLILEGDNPVGFSFYNAQTMWAARATNTFYAPAVATNSQGCLYIATSSTTFNNGYGGNLIKTDGLTAVRTGLPTASMTATAIAGGALAGTYKYKSFWKRVDAQGNIVEGPVSAVQTATYGGGNNQGTIVAVAILYSSTTGFQGRSAYKYTAEAPAAGVAFSVDDGTGAPGNNAFLQTGDPICLLDNTAPKVGLSCGTLHRTVCTFYDGTTAPSSIKVADSSGYTIPDNTPITTGLTQVILRTAAGGNQYYVLAEVPVHGYANFSFTDNVADAVLTAGEQYQEVTLGKEHNAPPNCSLVCQHQGGLVVARDFGNPNTVSFSSVDGIEYFPTASNSFDVPSTRSGLITAIASDTVDRLAVFKERAYYDVVGDLDGGNFSVNVKNEGDYGIVSQASLVRVHEKLIGLSRNGWVLINDGNLAYDSFRALSARVVNQDYNFAWATAVNDSFNRCYICSIPITGSEPVTFVIDYSREVNHTFERSYATKIDPVGGACMIGDTMYHLSQTAPYAVFRRLVRFNGNSPNVGNGDSFLDNTNAISYIFESQPINNNEPDVLNTPIRARIWSIPNDYVVEGWVPFSLLVEGGVSPIASYVGGTNPGATSSTLTFSTTNDIFKDVKLVQRKTHFYIIRFTTNTVKTAPFITGYDILYAENYAKEDLVK